MPFDFATLVGIGLVVFAAIVMYLRSRGDWVEEEDGRASDQHRDVLRAIKSMEKD